MSIAVFTGLPGSGKSYKLGRTVVDVLYRNQKYREKYGFRRPVWTNLKLKPEVEAEFGVGPQGLIEYWHDLEQIVPLRDCDIVIDEVATYFDARNWADLPLELRRLLAQHRKMGIEIYGTAQDFAQVDKAFRRLTSDLLYLVKIAGSRDISATRPPPKWVWGVVLVQTLDPSTYDELKSKFASNGLPRFMFINRKGVDIFDTRAEVAFSKDLKLKHFERHCDGCGKTVITHA